MKFLTNFTNTFLGLEISFFLGFFLLTLSNFSHLSATEVVDRMEIARNDINYAFQTRDISGLRILEIGTGLGYNAKALTERGATVDVIEPDRDALGKVIRTGLVPEARVHHAKIEDFSEKSTRAGLIEHGYMTPEWEEHFKNFREIPVLGEEFNGQFDILTIFMIAFDEGGAAKRLSELLKSNGTLVIGYATTLEYSVYHAGARTNLEKYFSVTSTVELFKECLDDDGTIKRHKLQNGPESRDDVYVTFTKRE